jgi:8-oxo-dGTP pyrophosphatase MutT (NUDIX family)
MTAPVIRRVARLELSFEPWVWPFAAERRAEIDAHFAVKQAEKPQMFNGQVLLGRNPKFTPQCFSADFFETDFASFLAWRDWGFPDRDIFNGFGMGAVRSNDGAYVLGEMAAHTANAGRTYFASGTPDRNDLRGSVVDISASVVREVEEEIGLTSADYRQAAHWDCVVTNFSVAMMRVLDVDAPGTALQLRLAAELARQVEPELCGIHLVRDIDDFTPTMPVFVTAFLTAQFAERV